jgi:hypothetical protein
MTIRLRWSGTAWEVVGKDVLTTALELDWAAFDALVLAELHGTTVELGDGVPADALELGGRLRERWKRRRER